MPTLDSIFKAYDIRGVVPDQLDAGIARAVGAAFAKFTGASKVLVGRDMRPSGVELTAAFAEGATSQGVDVVDLGLISTDLAYYAAGSLDAPAAMFTASHNPAKYNGIKLCLAGAKPVGQDTGLADIKEMVTDFQNGGGVPDGDTKGTVTEQNLLDEYAAHVRSFVDVDSLRPLKVVADTANGMGGLVAPAVFEGLPYELEIMFGELDGTFPNHPPDPINPENLKALQARVLEVGADVGLAFDGDADRVFLIDEKAQPISGSTTTAFVAKSILRKNPGEKVIYNLICSKSVPEIITENGGEPIRTRVGHSFIKSVMADTGAIFGGEHSGHYYFRDNYRADSGLIAAMLVLEELSRVPEPLSELRTPLERYAASGEVNVEVDDPAGTVERVSEAYGDADQERVDGLTVDLGDWWFNLRPSNTEPLLRLNLESPDEASCKEHLSEVLALMKEEK
ncbi:MAG TPA: phosphomannomutase/phosphoglucomutase [Acidimicrobiales bacterium]|nr:phosphomannomutase/phosphoglucomutase [Acidimicrobiales bacterium]